uniref:Engulfment and cell motility 1 n=1 Tax=Corvus moneduloides TaxID=1196302 RepID=A0A8C3ET61_CORMO
AGRSFPAAGVGCHWLPPPARANGSPPGARHISGATRGARAAQRAKVRGRGAAPLTWLRRARVSAESLATDHLPLPVRTGPPAKSSIKSFARCRVGGEFVIGNDGATRSLELKEKIQPEILELIKQQRLNRLVEGTCFRKLNSRRRQVPVADIKAVVTGKDCPHMKEKGALKQNKEVLELAFSILYDSSGQLNFIAPDKHEYCVWTDGLNALLGKDMLSDLTRNDLDTLLSMEIKLRLLDLENIQIPDAPPPIPKEPSNYDFVYDCN